MLLIIIKLRLMEPVVLAEVCVFVPAHSCQLGLSRHCNANLNTTQQLHRWSSPDKALLLLVSGNTKESEWGDIALVMTNMFYAKECPEVN